MPPVPPRPHRPRVVVYHQTHFGPDGQFVPLLPLVTEGAESVGLTHLIIAAIHLNEQPGDINLNNDPPGHPRNAPLWDEVAILQDTGVKALGMLGGAAKGTYERLDGSDEEFEVYYVPLREVLRHHRFDGLDLDVEEDMSLQSILRLIDRLILDFGNDFIITLAPVATALQGRRHLSGFDYEALEVMRGSSIAWYNTQFYNNWGNLETFVDYDAILRKGFKPEKIVVGVLTHPGSGHGYVEHGELLKTLNALNQFYPGFGGIFGWEYFNSIPGDTARPFEWAHMMSKILSKP